MRILIKTDDLKNELSQRKFKHLFHANSVETSITFVRNGSLFSREYCERNGLPQSSQWSDDADKKFGIYNDLFLNFQDLHRSFSGPNLYGPVLFCFDAEKTIDYFAANKIGAGITKKPPHKWKNTDRPTDRWLSSIAGVFPNPPTSNEAKHTTGWPDIVLSVSDGTLPLSLLDAIIVDKHPTSENFGNQLRSILKNCLDGQGLSVSLCERRFCKTDCKCKTDAFINSKDLANKYETGAWEGSYGKIA